MCLCVFCVGPLCSPPLRLWVLCGAIPSVWVPCGWGPPLSCSFFSWHLFLVLPLARAHALAVRAPSLKIRKKHRTDNNYNITKSLTLRLSPPSGASIGRLSGVGALWDCAPRVYGGGGGCAGGSVPLGAVPALSWCGEVFFRG